MTPEWRAKVQQQADNLHVPIYVMPDGKLHHLKPGDPVPSGAEVFHPKSDWRPAPLGEDPQKPRQIDVVPPVVPLVSALPPLEAVVPMPTFSYSWAQWYASGRHDCRMGKYQPPGYLPSRMAYQRGWFGNKYSQKPREIDVVRDDCDGFNL